MLTSSLTPVRFLPLALLCAATAAQAVHVRSLTPQGSVEHVQQIVLRTQGDAVTPGGARAVNPLDIQCSDGNRALSLPGQGRWNSASEWVWRFEESVPAGATCTLTPAKGFTANDGSLLGKQREARWQFSVMAPLLKDAYPDTYQDVDEGQFFALRLNAPATRESLLAHVHCRTEDTGERIPVRWIQGDDRRTVLRNVPWQEARQEANAVDDHLPEATAHPVLACARRLTAGTQVQLVYGEGVRTPGGSTNTHARTYSWSVRPAFTAEMSCTRERADTHCLPIRPISLYFSAPVDRALVDRIRLRGPDGQDIPAQLTGEDASTDATSAVQHLHFPAPFVAQGSYTLVLPEDIHDDAGRTLSNAVSFPLQVRMAATPALVKFAAAPFGVIERFTAAPGSFSTPPLLPLTVRGVEGFDTHPATGDSASKAIPTPLIRSLHLPNDADIIRWWNLVHRYDDNSPVEYNTARRDGVAHLPRKPRPDESDYIPSRTLSLLRPQSEARSLHLPSSKDAIPRPFEVIGLPLTEPGYHVVEVESPALGASLLNADKPTSVYVRTSALVTNLAVHFKYSGAGGLAWVTSLDQGRPVPHATVQVSDCRAQPVASGTTDAQGLVELPDLPARAPNCNGHEGSGQWFVSARLMDASGQQDMAFVWSDWQRGIEPWRFNLPLGSRLDWWDENDDHPAPGVVAHTVMDRTLFQTGETVSMKHFLRIESAQGLTLPKVWPTEVVITHMDSDQSFVQPLQWDASTHSATSTFNVPRAARLGSYTVSLRWTPRKGDGYRQTSVDSGRFRVQAFRLPVFTGSVQPTDQGEAALVSPASLPVDVKLDYLNGGAAAGQAVQVSAVLEKRYLHFDRWPDYDFSPPEQDGDDNDSSARVLVADKLPLTLDAQGSARVVLDALPQALPAVHDLRIEASFTDPSGEVQTLTSTHTLWPAAVVAGIRARDWVSVGDRLQWQALALDTKGAPLANVPLKVEAIHLKRITTRKRLVGGFYSYDSRLERKSLGTVCSGNSDDRGLLLCEAHLSHPGEVELVVTARDSQGRSAQASADVWVTGRGQIWFGSEDHNRMDVLPEKAAYAVGDKARLQVRMPFREATALVSVEREAILHTQIVSLSGNNPTIELPMQTGWGPNVYVSVLALRGRLYEVPWHSFFTWGWRDPGNWWKAWRGQSGDYVAPSSMLDLNKPAFRLGVAELRVEDPETRLSVQVTPEKDVYQIRDTALVTITATRADGTPAAGAQVTLAAVDQALLELAPNASWRLHEGMWQRRGWDVATATAQMEIVGRRHYGRKAAAPGGGGGDGAATRELLNTLLLWDPAVQLDAQGRAQVRVPLNDALSTFTIAAVAHAGVQQFGTGRAHIRTTQDLQIISGLPPVVRTDDQLHASITLRNTTQQPMQVQLTAQVDAPEGSKGLKVPAQTLEIPAQSAQQAHWFLNLADALPSGATSSAHTLLWTIEARDAHTGTIDALRVTQRLLPHVPVTVRHAQLVQVDGSHSQPAQRPAQSLPGLGGIRLHLREHLADAHEGLPGLRDWWHSYTHTALEQGLGRAFGLGDVQQWERLMEQLPTYLDTDGLALYFPAREGSDVQGSDVLTAHVLSVTHEMARLDKHFTLPKAVRDRMERGLIAFVDGRIERRNWSPRRDLNERKLAAVAALARAGRATSAMLESIATTPSAVALLPTHALLDWITIVQYMPQLPAREARLTHAWNQVYTRLDWQGTRLSFATESSDYWWWLMQDGDANAARLLLLALNSTQVPDVADHARIASGLLDRQRSGAWSTSVANTWADVALRDFSRRHEREAVSGQTTARFGGQSRTLQWSTPEGARADDAHALFIPWGASSTAGTLQVQHQGSGQPWATIQTTAAVPLTTAVHAGLRLNKTITLANGSELTRPLRIGDVVQVRLDITADTDMTWVALSDPIPTGATILGGSLGRDSAISSAPGTQPDWFATYTEHGDDSYRSYWAYMPRGTRTVQYIMRLSSAGDFALPPTRIEALYAPEVFGENPNARISVEAPADAR